MSEYDLKKSKPFLVLSHHSEFGKSRVDVVCPFCEAEFTAYIWSMAGGGKKCPGCGALHGGMGSAVPEIKPTKKTLIK